MKGRRETLRDGEREREPDDSMNEKKLSETVGCIGRATRDWWEERL